MHITIRIHTTTLTAIPTAVIGGNTNNDGETLLIELNYPLLPWLLPCKILEMADVEMPNNRATSVKDIPYSFTW